MNETIKNLIDRRSIKKYKSDMVPMEIIDQICEAGTYAANGRGLQAGLIIAVTDKAIRDKISALNAAVMGMDACEDKPGYTTVHAMAPKAELADYPIVLRAMTQGRGVFEYNVTGYDTVPQNVAQKVVAK